MITCRRLSNWTSLAISLETPSRVWRLRSCRAVSFDARTSAIAFSLHFPGFGEQSLHDLEKLFGILHSKECGLCRDFFTNGIVSEFTGLTGVDEHAVKFCIKLACFNQVPSEGGLYG